ncbi:hypothetical protein Trydic_g17621 [Trypoxylus dichotomus]
MASRTAPKTVTPDMEKTTIATATATIEKIGTSKQSAREKRRARRRGEAVDAIRMLQDTLPLASESTTDADSDDSGRRRPGNPPWKRRIFSSRPPGDRGRGRSRAIPLLNLRGGRGPGRNLLQRETFNPPTQQRTPVFHPSFCGKRSGGWPSTRK